MAGLNWTWSPGSHLTNSTSRGWIRLQPPLDLAPGDSFATFWPLTAQDPRQMPVLRAGLLRSKWPLLPIALCALLAAGIYATAGALEGDDGFCASCHVEPETTYYRHSRQQSPPTLAAFHAGEGARCIDCHSGRWIPGRLGAQWIGLGNLLAFGSGEFRQPAQTTRPTGDVGCTKCHSEMSWVRERPGHYHSPVLRRQWQAAGGPGSTCAACHPAHDERSAPEVAFLDIDRLEAQCEACHDS